MSYLTTWALSYGCSHTYVAMHGKTVVELRYSQVADHSLIIECKFRKY